MNLGTCHVYVFQYENAIYLEHFKILFNAIFYCNFNLKNTRL